MEVDGTVVTHIEGTLIVGAGTEQTRILLPDEWIVDGELLTREELFAGGYLSEGENVTVKALEANLIDKAILRISLTVGYEIIDDSGVHHTQTCP